MLYSKFTYSQAELDSECHGYAVSKPKCDLPSA